jgi:hypothetical protein
VAPVIRFHLGRVEAKKFYTRAIQQVAGSNKGGLGWSDTKFESVNWKALEHAIRNKPEGFQLWLSKQTIGVCATQKNTARIQDILDDRCPDCRRRREDSTHLNKCTDPGRSKLFQNGAWKLHRWMQTHNRMDPKLAFQINEYLLHRGQESMANLGVMSTAMREVAESRDGIGWVEFLHGKVSTNITQIQNAHCVLAGSNMNSSNWTIQFI